MKGFKLTVKIIAALLAIFIPFVSVPCVALIAPAQFQHTFVGELDDKVDRLSEIDEPKIVVVGGSSVAFGLDSAMLEEYTGMPVVNFGLYAALGTKLMLDLSEDHINEGDIVILAPELDAQTLSLYFSASTTLRATDGAPELLLDVPFEHFFSLLGSSWDFAAEKISHAMNSTTPNPTGVYNSANFNEYGDVVYDQKYENTMQLYYDPNTMIDLSPSIVSDDFIDYLNDYIAHCERRGAEVYFSYCPMNSLALTDGTTAESIDAFEKYLKNNINCTFISSAEDYILDPGYFYDTNFHLNDAGVICRTLTLTRDVLLELGIPKAITDEIPAPPALPQVDVRDFTEDVNAAYFEFDQLADGSYAIIGVKDEYREMTSLTVPRSYNTYKVAAIGASAFEGTSLQELIIPADTNIRILFTGCFIGASNLRSLIIYYPDEAEIMPPADFFGVHESFTVYVPDGSGYSTGYYWSERGLTFKTIE